MHSFELQGMDADWLRRRIVFLEARASVHLDAANIDDFAISHQSLSGDPVIRLACAGTLLRDAGATALLVGDIETARALLGRAGHAWSRLGLFAGYLLLCIASPRPWWQEHREDLLRIRRVLSSESPVSEPLEITKRQRIDHPLLVSSASSNRQLLDLYQSLQTSSSVSLSKHPSVEEVDAITAIVRTRLIEARSARIGGAQVSMAAYLALLDGICRRELDWAQQETLLSLIVMRQERLRVAREDVYRWRRMNDPANVIDFDTLALCLLAIASDSVDQLDKSLRKRDPWVALPLTLAKTLHEQPSFWSGPDRGGSDAGMAGMA